MKAKILDDLTEEELREMERSDVPYLDEILADAIERAGGLPTIRIAKPDDPIKEKEM